MIPSKLFLKALDLESEYFNNPTLENFKISTNYQDAIDFPFKASQEQLDYWNKSINRN